MLSTIIVQLIGFIAWIFLVLSYWKKKVNDILLLQIISCILFAIHYYCLGGMTGLYIVLFETIRDFLYYKSNEDLKIFFYSIPMYFLIAILNFKGPVSILPSFASLIDGFSLTTNKKILVVIGGIASYTVWLIYDIYIGSISGAITNLILVLSNIINLIANFKATKKRNQHNCQ